MRLTENITDIYKLFTQDTILMRLLSYYPTNQTDSPLDPTKPDIQTLPNYDEIISNVVKLTDTTTDMVDKKMCRLMIYAGRRRSQRNNYIYATQQVVFDVLVHNDIHDIDLRLYNIMDRIDVLLSSKSITGIGKVLYESSDPITAPSGYIAQRNIYTIGSANSYGKS